MASNSVEVYVPVTFVLNADKLDELRAEAYALDVQNGADDENKPPSAYTPEEALIPVFHELHVFRNMVGPGKPISGYYIG